jgi:hypothetical protein
LRDALAEGRPAVLVTREAAPTVDHIVITAYRVVGPSVMEVTVVATAAMPPRGVTTTICRGLQLDSPAYPSGVRPTQCVNAPGGGAAAAGPTTTPASPTGTRPPG